MAARAAQVAQVVLAGEARVDDVDRAAQPPAAQVALDLADDGLVAGVPGPHPHADGDPLAGDGQADDDLRQIGPVVLGVPAAAQPRRALADSISVSGGGVVGRDVVELAAVLVVAVADFEVRRGGVEEDHVDLEVQQCRDAEEHRLLHPVAR